MVDQAKQDKKGIASESRDWKYILLIVKNRKRL